MAGNFTLFTNDQGSAAGPTDYVKDVFKDVSLPATNNTGLTDNATVNPLGDFFGNSDSPKFGFKKLFLQAIKPVTDTSKWINNTKTYECIFNENVPSMKAYVFGNFEVSSVFDVFGLTFDTPGEGMIIMSQSRLAGILSDGAGSATSSIAYSVDDNGSSTGTLPRKTETVLAATNRLNYGRFKQYFGSQTLQSDDLHKFKYTVGTASPLHICGVVLLDNTSAYTFKPGTTYVDKSKITTTSGSTAAISTFGSSLGGTDLFYKTQASGYSLLALSATTVSTVAVGASGTNLLAVSTGHGASFPAGTGIVVAQGSSSFLACVTSVSTDTLTVSPTLPIGYSNTMYRAWSSNATLAISSTHFINHESIDFLNMIAIDRDFINSKTNTAFWMSNASLMPGASYTQSQGVNFAGGSGVLTVQGYFQAADIEFAGVGTLNVTMSINGLPTWGISTTATNALKLTAVTNMGPGFNSFQIQAGAAQTTGLQIKKVNLYKRDPAVGVSFGRLGSIDTLQAFVDRTAVNASFMALGTKERRYSNNMGLDGGWVQSYGASFAAGNAFIGSSSNTSFTEIFYGTKYAILGSATGGTLTLDGLGTPLTFNSVVTASLGASLHTLQYTGGAGVTIRIEALDVFDTKDSIQNLQNVYGYTNSVAMNDNSVLFVKGGLANSTNGNCRIFTQISRAAGYDASHLSSASTGSRFVINQEGMYEILYGEDGASSITYAISRNQRDLSSSRSIDNLQPDTLASTNTSAAGRLTTLTATDKLRIGDVLFPINNQSAGTGASLLGDGYFKIKRIR
jgi:hypothetical protein